MTDAATDQGTGNNVEGDCPLCLEPLPPFWKADRRAMLVCCGHQICGDCNDQRLSLVKKAIAEGSFGRAEDQLGNFCPLCRAKVPDDDVFAKAMEQKFNTGQLPLPFYHALGIRYQRGQCGVEQNAEKGMEILMLGAEKGDPSCQHAIGNIYRFGRNDVSKCPEKAKRWYLAAIEQGHAFSEYHLALLLIEEGNPAEGLQHLSASASKGYDEACFNLGVYFYYGEYGLQKCTEEAIRVLTPAAERGHALSMGLLGTAMCQPHPHRWLLDNPHFAKGMYWLRKAEETGEETTVSSLSFIEKVASSKCFRCGKNAPPEQTFLRCSRCRAAWYCSKDCQRRHWKAKEGGHKQRCIKW